MLMSVLKENFRRSKNSWEFCSANLDMLRKYDLWTATAVELHAILNSENRLQNTQRFSFSHPNGFDLFVLDQAEEKVSEAPAFRLRLHAWYETDLASDQGDIHNHAWDFCSFVLTGALRFQTFAEVPGRKTSLMHKFWYDTKMEAATDRGPIHLVPGLDTVFTSGGSYAFQHQTLHKAAPISREPCLTLVVTGPYQRTGSEVVLSNQKKKQQEFLGQKIGKEELKTRLRELLFMIEKGGSLAAFPAPSQVLMKGLLS